ncbi:hypothetical protein [Thermococcus sp.]
MRLVSIQSESSKVEDCIRDIMRKSEFILSPVPGLIKSSKILLSFGAFMNLKILLLIDESATGYKGIIVEYASGRHKDEAINRALDKINAQLKPGYQIIDFETGTYTMPVTRRTYAVGVVVYNIPGSKEDFNTLSLKGRRELIAKVLEMFNYNPKVLNISELARMFGVSRDSIYYDIEQILKNKKRKG